MEAKAATSVKLLNTFILPNDIQKCVAHFGDRLSYFAKDDGWSVSQAGSATALVFQGRYLLLATQHQLAQSDIGGICMECHTNRRFRSANQFNWVKSPDNFLDVRHVHDFCAFDFSVSVKCGDIAPDRFFDLEAGKSLQRDDEVSFLFAVGFAYADDTLEIDLDEESENLGRLLGKHSKKRILVCKDIQIIGDGGSFSINRVGDRTVNPDGFSGGPVFALIMDKRDDFVLKFAGIVISGNESILRVLPTWEIYPVLQEMFGPA